MKRAHRKHSLVKQNATRIAAPGLDEVRTRCLTAWDGRNPADSSDRFGHIWCGNGMRASRNLRTCDSDVCSLRAARRAGSGGDYLVVLPGRGRGLHRLEARMDVSRRACRVKQSVTANFIPSQNIPHHQMTAWAMEYGTLSR